jgi:hypothetical protein
MKKKRFLRGVQFIFLGKFKSDTYIANGGSGGAPRPPSGALRGGAPQRAHRFT